MNPYPDEKIGHVCSACDQFIHYSKTQAVCFWISKEDWYECFAHPECVDKVPVPEQYKDKDFNRKVYKEQGFSKDRWLWDPPVFLRELYDT